MCTKSPKRRVITQRAWLRRWCFSTQTSGRTWASTTTMYVSNLLYYFIIFIFHFQGYSFFCCTPKYHSSNQCPELDRLVLSPKVDKNGTYGDKFYYSAISVPIDGTVNLALVRYKLSPELEMTSSQDREPRHKGYWYLIVGNCDASSAVTLSLTGTTVWRNPYGWLPGQAFGFMIVRFSALSM